MGIIITKYEDSENNNVKFDVSKFDYSYDDDTFPSDAAEDFDEVIQEIGEVYYIIRETDTTDSMGEVTDIATENLRIYACIQDITRKDRQIHDMGLAVAGNRKMYVKPSYTITSGGVDTEYEVKEGDILVDSRDPTSANKWKIVQILKQPYLPGQEIYRTAIIKSIGLEGSG